MIKKVKGTIVFLTATVGVLVLFSINSASYFDTERTKLPPTFANCSANCSAFNVQEITNAAPSDNPQLGDIANNSLPNRQKLDVQELNRLLSESLRREHTLSDLLLNIIESNSTEDSDGLWLPTHPASTSKSCSNLTSTEFVVENLRRVEILNEECSSLNEKTRSKLSEMREIFNFQKSKLSWCPVYKAGSTNIFSHFCPDYYPSSTCSINRKSKLNAGMFRNKRFVGLGSAAAKNQLFTVVRHPFTRLLSAYWSKIQYSPHNIYKDMYTR